MVVITAYRVTFDASHKVKAGGHGQTFLQHVARDVDAVAGVVHGHANPNIDSARTKNNITLIPDGRGDWVRAQSMEQIMDRLAARLATVKKPPRENAVIMRPVVLNVSPEWFAEHNPDWKTTGLNETARAMYEALLAQAVEEYGAENIVCASLHMDEGLPQWQVAVTPVTEDGRLSQKDWYPNPAALKAMGKRFRQAVHDTGSMQVEFRPSPRSKEHLSSDEFQRKADRAKEDAEKAADKLAKAEDYGRRVEAYRRKVDAARAQVLDGRAELAKDREALDAERAELPELRRRARAEGREEGRAEGLAESAEDRRRAARDRAQAAEELDARVRVRKAAERAQRAAEIEREDAPKKRLATFLRDEGLTAKWAAFNRDRDRRRVALLAELNAPDDGLARRTSDRELA